jgi:capsular polysaccharide export protein
VHACLIDYPRYFHPETGRPCPAEAIVAWLSQPGQVQKRALKNRLLAKLQGVFASKAHLWR